MKRASITEELAYGTALDRLTGNNKPVAAAKKKEPTEQPNIAMIKLSVFLNREEDAYLENLASTAKFSGGRKISKTKLVEAMVRAFSTSGLDVRGVKTDEELLKRVIAQLR
ncbi:hypothetical protein ACFLXO_02170 [Chloroflexota bacterium]